MLSFFQWGSPGNLQGLLGNASPKNVEQITLELVGQITSKKQSQNLRLNKKTAFF